MAFLLLSYGAPEKADEVVPFLKRLLGNKVPVERIRAAAEKYHRCAQQTGGYSPLNRECQVLMEGIHKELGYSTLLYRGNLFWHPLLENALSKMAQDGVQKAACFVTSAFDSYASRGRYLEAIEAARKVVGSDSPEIFVLPPPFDQRLFLESQADCLLEALAWPSLDNFEHVAHENAVRVLFTAHSIPKTDADNSDYVAQLTKTCKNVAALCGLNDADWELAWQSRPLVGGPSNRAVSDRAGQGEWLEPDVKERVTELARWGKSRSVVVVPIGFFCENMETVNDLDLELGELCKPLGLRFYRARTVGASAKICKMIGEMCKIMDR